MDKIEEKIEKSKILPQEIKDNIDEICFFNNIVATLVMFFFAVVNYSYYKLETNVFMTVCKAMAFGMAVVSIGVLEHSYRKDDVRITLYGIESLLCAILTAFIPYVYVYSEDIYRGFIMTLPLVFAAYYVLKTIVSYVIRYRKYRLESITDIKELLNDSNEFKSYIDDEKSSKLLKEQKELEDKIKEEKKKIKELEKQRKILEKENLKKEKAKKESKLKKEETPKGKKRKIVRKNKNNRGNKND